MMNRTKSYWYLLLIAILLIKFTGSCHTSQRLSSQKHIIQTSGSSKMPGIVDSVLSLSKRDDTIHLTKQKLDISINGKAEERNHDLTRRGQLQINEKNEKKNDNASIVNAEEKFFTQTSSYQNKWYFDSERDTIECDTIFFMNGGKVIAQIDSMKRNKLFYKKCNNLDGPIIIEAKDNINIIKYADGTMKKFNKLLHGSSVAGIITAISSNVSLLSIIIATLVFPSMPYSLTLGIGLSIVSFIFSLLAVLDIQKQPKKFKMKKLAWAALILSLIAIIGFLNILTLVFTGNISLSLF